jgi:hypothetical protein
MSVGIGTVAAQLILTFGIVFLQCSVELLNPYKGPKV